MRFFYTLIIILFTGFSVSASVRDIPFSKKASISSDSIKSASSTVNYADSISFAADVLQKDNTKLLNYLPHQAVSNSSAILKRSDSLRAVVLEATNTANKAKLKVQDSLRLVASLIRLDSVRIITYRRSADSVKQQLKLMSLDSLKQQLKLARNNWFKGPIYTELASRYLNYDTLSDKEAKINFQSKAVGYTMQALHEYSSLNDTTGLRISFDNLAKVYFSQKRYPQAKWFILQSNTLSRAKNDIPNVITSLLTLSSIKSDIKDYQLATRDLDEALQLSITNHYQSTELDILKNYAMLYSRLKNYPKEALILKRRDSLQESIRKAEVARLTDSANAQALVQKKKLDSVQNKKKVYISNTRKLSKNASANRIASL